MRAVPSSRPRSTVGSPEEHRLQVAGNRSRVCGYLPAPRFGWGLQCTPEVPVANAQVLLEPCDAQCAPPGRSTGWTGPPFRVACLIWGVRCVLSLSPAIRTLATIRLPSASGRCCTASRCRANAPDPPKQTPISCADPGRPRVRRPKRSRRPIGGVHGLQFAASGHGRKRYKRGTNPPTFTPVDSISKHSTAESGSRHGLHQSAVGTPPIVARHVQRGTRFSPIRVSARAEQRPALPATRASRPGLRRALR